MPPATVSKKAPLFALAAFLVLFAPSVSAQTDSSRTNTSQTTAIPSEALDSLRFRNIGPAVTGGRIHDVEALPDDPSTIYVATASGGLWKSTNKGTTWKPIFEGKPVSTFGDLAIAPSNPDVLWAGTGEQNNRQSTSWGNGVYRSTDAGETWTHLGLEETRHIGKVRVHPENPDVAYVAALGNLWKASPERGVFKTSDGGETWDKVFYADSLTGVVDLVMDPRDPDVLYAAAYQRLRRTWGFNGGGPGSGIFKTSDGGETWEELTNGIPEGDKGRIGLALAENSPDVLYATIQHAEESGTYRTSDGGQAWEKVNELNPRPMYYSHIFVDPKDADRVYVLGVEFYRSEDGGETFYQLPTRPTYDVGVHSDHHSLWIDPNNTEHFYLAGDAGLHETWDRGTTYTHLNNFAIGQFYAIGLDMREPYRVYGGMQDNHSWMGPSATRRYIGIINDDWMQTGFGDGMYQQADPTSHRYAYVTAQNGNLARLDAETGDLLDIAPAPPEGEEAYRFDWVNPVILSRHDPQTVYFGGNRLFISKDRGVSWTRTDDLTKAIERDSLYLMGVQGADTMLSENDGTSTYSEIITIAESPLDAQILWVGTDDGNVQVSQDGGQTWNEVSGSIDGVGDTTYVSRVVASSKSPGTAFVTFDAHRDGDFGPYVYRTSDFGATWTSVAEGLPEIGSVNVIAEHPDNPDVLFLGTEHALFVSMNAGDAWTPFTANLPTTHYDDLAIHPRDKDLVLGTHGRSIWILDDTTPIAEWTSAAVSDSAHLFSIQPATFFHYWKNTSYRGQAAYNGENPAFGALISYHLPASVDSVRLVVTSAEGDTVRTLSGPGTADVIHRVVWNLEHTPPEDDEDDEEEEGLVVPDADSILPKLPRPNNPRGPFVAPGTYTVTLEAGDTRVSQPVEVRGDPEMEISQEQYETREAFLLDVLALQREAFEAAEATGALSDELSVHRDSLGEGEDLPEDMAVRADTAKSRAGRLDQLRERVYGLAGEFNGRGVRQGTLYPPTETHRARLEQLQEALRRETNALDAQEQTEEGGR